MRRDGADEAEEDDLLLFRAVTTTDGRATALRSLRAGMGGRLPCCGEEVDVWELRDPTDDDGEEAAAVAAARRLGDGSKVELLGVVVSPPRRRRGIGLRMIDELTQSFRAHGVATLLSAVPDDAPAAMGALRRAGFRPRRAEPPCDSRNGVGLVWFDVEL